MRWMHDQATSVGQRVRLIRRRRGITQQVLADRSGLKRSAIANYETGTRAVDSRKTLHALASALGVTIGDLTGQPEIDKLDPAAADFHAAIPGIETILWTHGDTTDEAPPRTLTQLRSLADKATFLRQDGDYTTLGPMLGPMLADSYRHLRDNPGPATMDLHGVITYGVASALRARGYHALAWTAAHEATRAAEQTGSAAAAAAAAYVRSHILLTRTGALPTALAEAETAAARLSGEIRTRGEVETYGMLHLQSSLVTAALGGDPTSHLAEAAAQAGRLTGAAPGGGSLARNRTFGAANVTLWRMSAAMEQREPGQVLTLAAQLRPDELPAAGRKAQYFVEIGRAHAMRRDYTAALHALLRAELHSPQYVRGLVYTRELVALMMRKGRRDLTQGDLGKLARRIGVSPI